MTEETAPTPQELMAFADGELDDARAEEVALWLEENPDDARRVAEMSSLGDLVQESAEARAASFDIADDVMSAIDRLDAANRNAALASIPPAPRVLSSRPPELSPRTAARRRSRRATYALGASILAVAAAAAAGLVMFLQTPAPELTAGPISSMATLPDVEAIGQNDDRPLDPATAVDVVDFGAHQGTIFYVPSGASTSTTVVWIADEEGSN